MRRRSLLGRVGLAIATGFAGCTDTDETGTPTAMATATRTATPTPTDEPTEQPTARPTETQTPSPTAEETPTETETDTPTATPSPDYTVRVGPNATFTFDPAQLTLAAGETVEWVWDSSGHNVRPDSTPAGSRWTGTPGGDDETYDQGYVHRHTFAVAGEYDYYCAPHRQFGMTGSLTVE